MTDQKRIMDLSPVRMDKAPLSPVEQAKSIWPLEWEECGDTSLRAQWSALGCHFRVYVHWGNDGFFADVERDDADGVSIDEFDFDPAPTSVGECVMALRSRVVEMLEEALREVRGEDKDVGGKTPMARGGIVEGEGFSTSDCIAQRLSRSAVYGAHPGYSASFYRSMSGGDDADVHFHALGEECNEWCVVGE